MCAQFSVVTVCWNRPDHVSWIDILESGVKFFGFAIVDDFRFEKSPDILNKSLLTGNLTLLEESF
jgi:hypothetical protein